MFDIEILSGFFCRIGCRVKKKVELVASSERRSIELSKNKEVPLVACNGDIDLFKVYQEDLDMKSGPCQTSLMKRVLPKIVKGTLK